MWPFILVASLESLNYKTYQSISPAKVREKPPGNAKIGKMECGGRENILHLLRMLHKWEGGPRLAISISLMTETPATKYQVASYIRSFILVNKFSSIIMGSRDGAVVRALASHRCGLGSIPGPAVTCGLSLLLVLVPAPRVFLRVLRFSSLHKNQHF